MLFAATPSTRLGRVLLLLLALSAAAPALLHAQTTTTSAEAAPVGLTGPLADLARGAEVAGESPAFTVMLRHFSETGRHNDSAFVRILPVLIHSIYNSGYADDRDNGAVWAGRGASGLARFGVALHWGWLSAALQPEAVYWQNQPYAIRTRADGGHPFDRLDLPQRFGAGATAEVVPGQSYVRLDAYSLGIGLSNENVRSGPALRYPILLGNSAPGFPHFFLGTNEPLDLWIAQLNARAILGWTEESEYFDAEPANDIGNIFLWALSAQPRGLDWLEIGLQRSYHYVVDHRFDFDSDLILRFVRPSTGNRVGDEIASIFFRALLPASQAELYGEWARADRFVGWTNDFLTEPDHSQGWVLGAQKRIDLDDGGLRLHIEFADLQEEDELREGAGRFPVMFYTHHDIRKGYTHRGQILGASIGPGSDAQFFGVDYMADEGWLSGVFAERVRRFDSAGTQSGPIYNLREAYPFIHDVEVIGGVRGLTSWRDLSLSGSIAWQRRYHRMLITPVDDNLHLTLEIGWRPEVGLPGKADR